MRGGRGQKGRRLGRVGFLKFIEVNYSIYLGTGDERVERPK